MPRQVEGVAIDKKCSRVNKLKLSNETRTMQIAKSSVSILYDPEIPVEVKDIISPIIDKYSMCLPSWLLRFYIAYSPEMIGSLLETGLISRQYEARLDISGHYMMLPQDRKERAYLHELSHMLIIEHGDVVFRLFEVLKDYETIEPETVRFYELQLNDGEEKVVESMADMLYKSLNGAHSEHC